jgi:hypothetical protein
MHKIVFGMLPLLEFANWGWLALESKPSRTPLRSIVSVGWTALPLTPVVTPVMIGNVHAMPVTMLATINHADPSALANNVASHDSIAVDVPS